MNILFHQLLSSSHTAFFLFTEIHNFFKFKVVLIFKKLNLLWYKSKVKVQKM